MSRTIALAVASTLLVLLGGCSAAPPLPPAGSTVYLIGDSWATGYSADPGNGYVDVLARETGWNIEPFAESGTGYVANLLGTGDTFPDRVSKLPTAPPDMVIVQGSTNDGADDATIPSIPDAVARTISAIAAKYPDVAVVIVGPGLSWKVPSPEMIAVDAAVRDAAARASVRYISPIEEGWQTPENFTAFIDTTTWHPTNEGHRLFAEHILDDLRNG